MHVKKARYELQARWVPMGLSENESYLGAREKGWDSKQGNLRNKISGTKMNINSRQEGKKNAKIG